MRSFLRNNFLVFVLLNSANAFNYFFQMVVGRSLTLAEYGTFNSVNSMAVVLSAPVAVLPMLFSRYTVQLALTGSGKVKSLLMEGFRTLFFAAGGILLLGLFAIGWLKGYLHLDTTTPILIMLVQLALSFLLPGLLGVLQGLQRFVAFSIGASSVTLIRFLGALLFVLTLGWGVNGALLSGTVGACVALGIGYWAVRDILRGPREPLPPGFFRGVGQYAGPVFLTTTAIMALGNLDVVLVRHYCSVEEAGLYSTAAVLGRVALFLPNVLLTVLFPEAAKAQETGKEDTRIIWVSLGLTALLAGGVAFFCAIWPERIIGLLFGEKYRAAAPLLQIIGLAMAMLAVANVVFIDGLARSRFGYLWFLVGGVCLMLTLIFMFHDSALTIARMILIAVSIILVGTLSPYLLRFRKPVPAS